MEHEHESDGVGTPQEPSAGHTNYDRGSEEATPRRGFFAKLSAVVLGTVAGIVPAGAGVWVIANPLLRTRSGNGPPFIKVASLESVPADGQPRDFKVMADRQDAWTRHFHVPVGSVYLVRHEATPDKIVAFNTTCPHLGCYVNALKDNSFHCPCHNSQFNNDGSRGAVCVAARGLDELTTRIEDGKVLVQFQNFKTAKAEKVPVS